MVHCGNPRGIAANPSNGHLYVADQANRRIDEFNALGRLVRVWGWDVVASGPDEDTTPPEDQFEICVPDKGDVCKGGTEGAGVGQFGSFGPQGVALDSAGNVYVVDFSNRRVEKFSADGHFLLMFGGKVNETSGGNVCPRPGFPADVCKAVAAASGGGEAGEFGAWKIGSFVAIDNSDKVYVGDESRIQRFDTDGVYQGEIAIPGETVKGLATDIAGDLYAIYNEKPAVRKITAAGVELASPRFKLPKAGVAQIESQPTAVAVDGAGRVFAFGPTVVEKQLNPLFEFSPAGAILEEWDKEEFSGSTGLATNLCAGSEAPGNVYATNAANGTGPPHSKEGFIRAYGTEPIGCFKARTLPAENVEKDAARLNGTVNPDGTAVAECRFQYGTDETYGSTAPCVPSAGELGTGSAPVPVHADVGSLTKGTVYHFRLVAKVGGELETGSDEEFKTLGPPVVSEEQVLGATDTEATLEALVNPEGFATTYRFEYGLDETYGQQTATIGVGSDRSDHPAVVHLKGLLPGTTYHWRVVAVNSSGTSEGEDRTLTTFRTPQSPPSCPNEALRGGPSAFLPDCRAYEMVTPVDKNGGDIIAPGQDAYAQATPEGDKITYSAFPVFGDQPNGFAINQYLASRGSGGWSDHGIHPPVPGERVNAVTFGLTREFMAFTADLCNGWLVDFQTPAPTPDGQEGFENLYRRDNCGAGEGGLETLVPAPPALPPTTGLTYLGNTSVQGVSADGSKAFFVAGAALPQVPEAAVADNKTQVYERSGGKLSLVSVLPNGSAGDPAPGDGRGFADPSGSAVGSGWFKDIAGAVSGDGERVYWSSGFNLSTGLGKIYLRLRPEQGIVAGECTGASPCTVAVSSGEAAFWAATPDGAKALYSEQNIISGKNELYEFEEGQPRRKIAGDIKGVVGWSRDLSHVYLTSEAVLGGSGKAVAGQPNLYLASGGTFSFVATLAAGDVGGREPGAAVPAYELDSPEPRARASRVSPDGGTLAFESRAQLDPGFDNSAAGSGKPAVEVYIYEAGAGRLLCVSCNPAGARPAGREVTEPYVRRAGSNPTLVIGAAWIPTTQQPLNTSNVLSAGGGRLFFNANDALLPRDTNGAQDVYEWEAAGVGGCSEADPSFFAANGGCLYLISSGENPYESEFWEASADGRDVFFTTESSLVPQDPGLVDLYDARIGGGFAQAATKAPCEGEACQSPPPAPEFATPASASEPGPGNVPGIAKQRCPRGKHKAQKGGKARCVKSKPHRKHRAKRNRRAGR